MSDGPVVGIAGAVDETVVSAVETAGAVAERGDAATVADSDYVVSVGEPTFLSVARSGTDAPVLPVDAGRGVRSVSAADGAAAVERLLAGEYDVERHPLVDVTVADRTRVRVAMDAMLVTADPGEISEYGVHADGRLVSRFRADGVVVATPAGSAGYARRAGGPILAPETGVAAVVPVAPFATDPNHWVLELSSVSLSVERDETPVHLLADDRLVGEVRPDERVRLAPGGSLAVAVVPGSRSAFEG